MLLTRLLVSDGCLPENSHHAAVLNAMVSALLRER